MELTMQALLMNGRSTDRLFPYNHISCLLPELNLAAKKTTAAKICKMKEGTALSEKKNSE
jgi:hypothetical protein